jgi:hypothetical protein
MWSISHFGRRTSDTYWIGTSEDTLTGLEFVAKIKFPASTEYRTPVARTGTATSLSELPASYHNLRLSVKSKNLNYVATRTINLFLPLVIRLPGDTVSKIFIVKQSRGIYSFLGTASSTFTDRNSDVCGIYKQ